MKYILTSCLCLLFLSPLLGENTTPELNRFFKLRTLYGKWRDGFFGSKKVHKRALQNYLWSIYNKKLQTEHDYILVRTGGMQDPEIATTIAFSKWLHIKGTILDSELKSLRKNSYELPDAWWRTKKLVAISGTLKKFKLDYDVSGDIIILYLDTITLIK